MIEFFKEHKPTFIQIILSVLMLLLGVALTKTKIMEELNFWVSVGLIVGIAIMILGSVSLAAMLVDHSKNTALEIILERYKNKAEALEGDWFYSMRRLQHYEREFAGDAILLLNFLLQNNGKSSC